MARIFKPRYPKMRTLRHPDGKPIMVKKTAARGPNKGRTVLVPVREPARGQDGNIVYTETKAWAIEYTDATGHQRTASGYTDKLATSEKAARIEKAVARQREGIVGVDVQHAESCVTKHIAAWVADLQRSGRSPGYVRKVKRRIERLAKDLQWSKPASIRPDKLTEWLGTQSRSGLAQRTLNHYIEAGVAFCNWAVAQGRLEANPLQTVSKVQVVEPSRQRRALAVPELRKLIGVHPTRGVVYLTAALTGLRRAELAGLQWGDVRLDNDRPHIALRASQTKSRRADTIALNREIAERLGGLRPRMWQPSDRVFPSVPKSSTFVVDLAAAGIPRDVDGKRCDFHSLRYTHGTLLATSGVSIREAMEQMRHTDIRLTTKVYTDPRLLDLNRAVNRLPRVQNGKSEQLAQRATGTDNAVPGLRADIRKELSAPVRKGSKTAFSVPVNDTDESEENTIKTGVFNTAKQWRRGESNPRPATDPEWFLRA